MKITSIILYHMVDKSTLDTRVFVNCQRSNFFVQMIIVRRPYWRGQVSPDQKKRRTSCLNLVMDGPSGRTTYPSRTGRGDKGIGTRVDTDTGVDRGSTLTLVENDSDMSEKREKGTVYHP